MKAVGVDLGGTHLRVGLVTDQGKILREERIETPKTHQTNSDLILDCMQSLIKTVSFKEDIEGVGIAVPGIVESEGQVTSYNLRWNQYPLGKKFPGVYLANDMHAAALGELKFGAAKGCKDILLITFSSGVGAGIIKDGQIHLGVSGTAGEVGHMTIDIQDDALLCSCGRRGCWERYASGTAHKLRVLEAVRSGTWDWLDFSDLGDQEIVERITQMAREGDQAALELIKRTRWFMAVGLTNLVNIINPEIIVLTGGLTRATWDLIGERLEEMVNARSVLPTLIKTKVKLTTLGDNGGLLGAASLVFQNQ